MAKAASTPGAADEDRALVDGCLRGDAAAWAAFVDRYARLVYSVPRRYRLRPEGCDEVFQNVFEIVLRQLHTLSDPAGLPKWLITISVRESLRHLRGSHPRAAAAEPDHAPPPDGEIAAMEERQRVRDALAELGGPCRALLEALFSNDSPDYAAISAGLGIPIGSIGPTRARCLAKLQQILISRHPDAAAESRVSGPSPTNSYVHRTTPKGIGDA